MVWSKGFRADFEAFVPVDLFRSTGTPGSAHGEYRYIWSSAGL